MRARSILLALSFSLIAGCSTYDANDDDDREPTGTSTFAITSVPTDVRCIKVTVAGATRTVEKKYDVSPSSPSVYKTGGLPTGNVVVTAGAFSGLCNATGPTPTWIADAQTVSLKANVETQINLTLKPNGRASISADFQADQWIVSTYAGTVGTAGTTDGVGTNALFQSPWGLATNGNHLFVQSWPGITRDVDLATATTTTRAESGAANCVVLGNALYVAAWWTHSIRKLDLTTNTVTLFAGSGVRDFGAGWVDGIGTAARFFEPTGITTDGVSLFVADHTGSIRKIDPTTAEVTTVAGSGASFGVADGTLTTARFLTPSAITFANGILYVADRSSHDIRAVDLAQNSVTRIAGTANVPGTQDGVGTSALFDQPNGIAADAEGNIIVADTAAHVVRKIYPATGVVMTIAGAPYTPGHVNAAGPQARFSRPMGVAVDASGNIYVSEWDSHVVRKLARP